MFLSFLAATINASIASGIEVLTLTHKRHAVYSRRTLQFSWHALAKKSIERFLCIETSKEACTSPP